MANIYDVASAIQQPNFVGNFQQGIQTARQNQSQDMQLAQQKQAMADQQQLRSLAPQVVAGDPSAYAQAAALNPDQANAYQSASDTQLARLKGAINYIDQQQTPQAKEAAYQGAVKPYLDRIGAAQGKTAPATFAEAEPLMEAARAKIASLPPSVLTQGMTADQKNRADLYQNLTPDQRAEANRIRVGLDPRATNPNYSVVNVPDGKGGSIQAFLNKHTGQLESPNYSAIGGNAPSSSAPSTPSGAPINNDSMAPYLQEANRRIQNGESTDSVDAWLRGVANQMQQPSSGALGYTPAKSEQTKAPTGYRFASDGSGNLEPIPGGPADKGGSAAKIGDQTKSGQEFLQSVSDPGMQHMIQAIAEGRMAVPKVYRASKGGEIGASEIAQAVNSYDPSFDAVNYNARQGTLKGFTSGKEAQTINALNTVAEHLGTLSDATDDLHNSDYQFVNRIGNAYLRETGDPRIARFDTVRKAAADEIAKVWRASGGSQADIEENLKNLDGAQSPAQLHAAIGTLVQLIGGKLSALQDQYNSGMGIAANRHSIVSPAAQQSFQKVLKRANMSAPEVTGNSIQSQPNVPQAAQQPAQGNQADYSHLWGG